MDFLASQQRCVVAMEACASAHGLGREIAKLGHSVRLIPPIYGNRPVGTAVGPARHPPTAYHRSDGRLITGAMAVVQNASRKGAPDGCWLGRVLAKKPRMLVAIALANKMARGLWAMITTNEDFKNPTTAAA